VNLFQSLLASFFFFHPMLRTVHLASGLSPRRSAR
jgi:hypothetical protein